MSTARRVAALRLLIVIAGGAVPFGATAYVDGPVPGRTGGFGEMTCHQCHWDSDLNDPAGQLALAHAPALYTPGERYLITVKVTHPELVRGGFQLSARYAAGPAVGRSAGILRATDAFTQPVSNDDGRVQYIQHTRAGASGHSRGVAQWTVEWTAPAERAGVTFHAAANASNGDDSPLGDFVYTTSATSQPALAQAGRVRLPQRVFDVTPPSALVRGAPGTMTVQPHACRSLPIGATRRRVVDIAVQEWGFFGFRIADPTDGDDGNGPGEGGAGADGSSADVRRGGRRLSRLGPEEAARVAASIAGYWAVTPEGSWIVARQNDAWMGPDGIAARWNAPWSAAFVSWVMCEAGLGSTDQFQRAIAHHAYVDQSIRARDGRAPRAAFVAFDVGETVITPGDLLCASRRPVYRTIAERRRQIGAGARSHCDVVVKVDEAGERILVIGGNVRGAVSLKLLPAVREVGKPLRPQDISEGARPTFAHLKLQAGPIAANAMDSSPTLKAFGSVGGAPRPGL